MQKHKKKTYFKRHEKKITIKINYIPKNKSNHT